jgi:hypothetical protein
MSISLVLNNVTEVDNLQKSKSIPVFFSIFSENESLQNQGENCKRAFNVYIYQWTIWMNDVL